MKNYYLKSIVFLSVFFFTLIIGCATLNPAASPIENIKCNVQKSLLDASTVAVAGMLKCSNTENVRLSMTTIFGNTNLCEEIGRAHV